jgi:hypothetical protein
MDAFLERRESAWERQRKRERERKSESEHEDSQPNMTESMNRAGGKRRRLPGLQPAVHDCMTKRL